MKSFRQTEMSSTDAPPSLPSVSSPTTTAPTKRKRNKDPTKIKQKRKFEWTEARRAGFEKCKQARQEALARKRKEKEQAASVSLTE